MSIFLPNYINKIIIFLITLFIVSCTEKKDPVENLLKAERFEKVFYESDSISIGEHAQKVWQGTFVRHSNFLGGACTVKKD